MAINAYTGLMGSGKSYEVVENVILPALLAGRRVVTNVANLQQDDIAAYLVEKFGGELAKLGVIVQVQNDDLLNPEFFPVELLPGAPAVASIVQPGDLVVIDECWRWWAAGAKITPAHMTFFRMHRHFVCAATAATCDLVLVVQDIGDLDRKLKVVVENTYRMSKHKALGSVSRYRVDVYLSYKTTKAPYRSLQRKYNKEIFALYQSYSQSGGGSGKEVAIDSRANIFKGALFKLALPLLLVVLLLAVFFIWRFFHPKASVPVVKAVSVVPGQLPPVAVFGSLPPAGDRVPESSWRVAGSYKFGQNQYVIISRSGVLRTLVNPKGWYIDGLRANGSLHGETLTNYTGGDGPSLIPGRP